MHVLANDIPVNPRREGPEFFNSSPEPFICLDETGAISGWNHGAELSFGWLRHEVMGRTLAGLVSVELLNPLTAACSFDSAIWHRDGRSIPITITIWAADERKSFWFGLVRDRTHLRDAQAANEAKSDFLAAMSHEIRNPLNALLGMADLLSGTGLDPEQEQYLDTLRRAGAGMLQLVDRSLDIARVESGRVALEAASFDLRQLLRETVELMRPLAETKCLEIVSRIHASVPELVTGDAGRLRQILLNLIGNAVKFTEMGGVRIVCELDPGHGPHSLRFSVSDTGIGIPGGEEHSIFSRFQQASDAGQRRLGGSGLGLFISKTLIEKMGGAISVASELGKGSTFQFHAQLPQATTPLEPAAPVEQPDVEISGPVAILLCEDSRDNASLIEAYLKNTWHSLATVTDGAAAVEAATTGKYDVILMDLEMPVMDGLTATRAIREWENRSQVAHVPILALTAHAFESMTESILEAGCSAHLIKPITKPALLRAIGQHAGKQAVKWAGLGAADHPVAQVPSIIAGLLPEYLSQRHQDVRALNRALERNALEDVRVLGHNLKGSGGGYGFPEISRLGASIERAAKRCDRGSLTALLACLSEYLYRVEVVIQP